MENKLPLTVKRSVELLGLMALGTLLYIGADLIMPIVMAFFIAIMLLPVNRFFRRLKVPEGFAIILSIVLLALFLAAIGWFFSSQVAVLIKDFPEIKQNVQHHLQTISQWVGDKFGVSRQKQVELLNERGSSLTENLGSTLGGAAGTVSSTLMFIGLLPIYIFLITFYKDTLLRFIFMWFKSEYHPRVKDAIYETESIIKSYLIGLLIQITYMTVLLGGGLYLLNIPHALLIGVIFALLNLIPYVGALIGNLIGVALTLTSSQDLTPVITVLVTIAVVQFLDNNILMPRIVGSKVKINALFAIIAVFLGGTLAGISGMFLALPIMAILKIIFDRADAFKQWGVLLGDERPTRSPMQFPMFRKKTHVPTKEGTTQDGGDKTRQSTTQ